MVNLNVELSSMRPPRLFWALLAVGIILAAEIPTIFALMLMGTTLSGSASFFYVAAPLAALLVGLPVWYRWIVVAQRATIKRGLLVGAVCSICAHPIMWASVLFTQPWSQTGQSPVSLILGAPFMACFSLIFVGWITTPFGALAGILLICLQRAITYAWQPPAIRKAQASRKRESKGHRRGKLRF
jgi:hypothetical protein